MHVDARLHDVTPAPYPGALGRAYDAAQPPDRRPGAADRTAAEMTRRRRWARDAAATARARYQLASAAGDHLRASAAARIAMANEGVARVYRQFQGDDGSRASVAAKKDAGDTSCPEYLDRQARERRGTLLAPVAAAHALGYDLRLLRAEVDADKADQRTAWLGDKRWRERRAIVGAAVNVVPLGAGRALLVGLLVLGPGADHVPLAAELGAVELPPSDGDLGWLDEAARVARAAGPAEWVRWQIDERVRAGGKTTRNYAAVGAFYGAAARADLVQRAATARPDAAELAVTEAARGKAAEAAAIATAAAAAGDLLLAGDAVRAARAALGEARAAIRELREDRAEDTSTMRGSLVLAQLEIVIGEAARARARERHRQREEGAPVLDEAVRGELGARLAPLLGEDKSPKRRWRHVGDFDVGLDGERIPDLVAWARTLAPKGVA